MFIKIQNGMLFNTDHAKCFYKSSRNHTNKGNDSDVMSYYIEAESIVPTIDPVTIGTYDTFGSRDEAFTKLTQSLAALVL